MKNLPENYELIQRRFTSNSRGTRMGKRVQRNVLEMSKYLKPPVLCVGAGDGLEVDYMKKALNTDKVLGVEVAHDRVAKAQKRGLNVIQGTAENLLDIHSSISISINIYMAHTLEHCYDKELVIENLKKICLDTIVIIVPIELKGRTSNRSHFSPISNLGVIANMFGMDFKVINMGYRMNIELEGYIVLKRDPMNWPEKLKNKSSELLIKGNL